MGSEVSREERQEKSIIRSPNVGQACDLYWACRAGDIDHVRRILATTNFSDLNHLEPNGSTALHAASFFGHGDVVRLLLREQGVMRYRKNRHDLTAYEEAANDEIRQLFYRPNSNRFCDNSTNNARNVFNVISEQELTDVDDNDEASDNWVEGTKDVLAVRNARAEIQSFRVIMSSSLLRPIIRRIAQRKDDSDDIWTKKGAIANMQEITDKYITSTHSEYNKACELLLEYKMTNKVEHLLRLHLVVAEEG